jgi:hypothetical protein
MRRPDPNYEGTRADVQTCGARVRERNDRLVVLDLDEVDVERQPTLANSLCTARRRQPRAQLRQRDTTLTRRVGALNAVPGCSDLSTASTITMRTLYSSTRMDVPPIGCGAHLGLQDNWPIHTRLTYWWPCSHRHTWPFYRRRTGPASRTRQRASAGVISSCRLHIVPYLPTPHGAIQWKSCGARYARR